MESRPLEPWKCNLICRYSETLMCLLGRGQTLLYIDLFMLTKFGSWLSISSSNIPRAYIYMSPMPSFLFAVLTFVPENRSSLTFIILNFLTSSCLFLFIVVVSFTASSLSMLTEFSCFCYFVIAFKCPKSLH